MQRIIRFFFVFFIGFASFFYSGLSACHIIIPALTKASEVGVARQAHQPSLCSMRVIHYQLARDQIKFSTSRKFSQSSVQLSRKTIDDIIQEARPGRKTRGRTQQFEKLGSIDDAFNDFEGLYPFDVKNIPAGKVGRLSDGRMANARAKSKEGRPTLEIYDGKKSIKIRYGPE